MLGHSGVTNSFPSVSVSKKKSTKVGKCLMQSTKHSMSRGWEPYRIFPSEGGSFCYEDCF